MKDSIVRIAITLLDVDPAIWRRIEVPASFTLKELHDIIQAVMGWADYHLHHFQIGGIQYGEPTPEDRDIASERKLKLSTLAVDGERSLTTSTTTVTTGAALWCWKRSRQSFKASPIRGSSRGPGAVLPRMSAAPGATTSFSKPSPTPSTNATRNCAIGAAKTSIQQSSTPMKLIAPSRGSHLEKAPAANLPNRLSRSNRPGLPAVFTGCLPIYSTFRIFFLTLAHPALGEGQGCISRCNH